MAEGGTGKTWVEPIFQCKIPFPRLVTLSIEYFIKEMEKIRKRTEEEKLSSCMPQVVGNLLTN